MEGQERIEPGGAELVERGQRVVLAVVANQRPGAEDARGDTGEIVGRDAVKQLFDGMVAAVMQLGRADHELGQRIIGIELEQMVGGRHSVVDIAIGEIGDERPLHDRRAVPLGRGGVVEVARRRAGRQILQRLLAGEVAAIAAGQFHRHGSGGKSGQAQPQHRRCGQDRAHHEAQQGGHRRRISGGTVFLLRQRLSFLRPDRKGAPLTMCGGSRVTCPSNWGRCRLPGVPR